MSAPSPELPVTVAIPTYNREAVLVDTIRDFLRQERRAAEILVVDQTLAHDADTEAQLSRWNADRSIRWLRLTEPSQPAALNHALREATQPFVLFVDDDIAIGPRFVEAHVKPFDDVAVWAVVGQVLQPGESENPTWKRRVSNSRFADLDFNFASGEATFVQNGMSGNLTVRRDRALAVGAFDENFLPPVSYRFDTEFCKRIVRAGGLIRFEPGARIHHLRAPRGGTRSIGSHLTSASAVHGVGDYYFALRQGFCAGTMKYIAMRPFREVRTRFHLRHPWWIPVKLFGELRAFLLAVRLLRRGPRYVSSVREALA